MATRPSSLNS